MEQGLRTKRILNALLLTLAILPVSTFAQAEMAMIGGKLRPLYREGQVIVKYKDGAIRTRAVMNNLYSRLNVLDVRKLGKVGKNLEQLVFDPIKQDVEATIAELKRDPSVEYAQPNYMLYALDDVRAEVKPNEACIIPGLPYPPGCDDSGGEEPGQPDPGNPGDTPCIIPGLPYPPGCKDSGSTPGTPSPGANPDIQAPPAEVNPPAADPDLAKAYGIEKVGATKAWAINRGSKDIVVAVIDTGIDYNHPDVAGNVWRNPGAATYNKTGVNTFGDDITGDVVGYDFANNDAFPFDDHSHGTHCAGVIGAVGGNGVGVSGVNQKASIMGIKFLDSQGSGDSAAAIKAIDYAVSRGAKVLSNSWGGGADPNNAALKESIVRAEQKGVLFIAAAGNDSNNNDSNPTYPASFNTPNMIAVAATDANDGMAYFSNYGVKSVHVGAPGMDVYSTVPGGYEKMSGTSMACPHVAGVAALIWAQYPTENYKQIKERLISSGDSIRALATKTISGKRVNVFNALNATNP